MIHGRRNGKMPSGQRLGRIRHFIQRTELFAYLIQRIDVCSPMKRIRHQYAIGPLIRRCPAESPMIGTHAVTPELKATVAVVDRSGQQWVTDTQTIMLPRLIKEIKDIHISFRLNKETGRPDTYLNGVNVENKIRSMEVSSKVSPISTLDFVREAMVAQQQAMGNEKGIVMDGRDIGTTVFPDAELKIFVTATPEIRAQRRYDELKAKGQEASFDEILENVKQRDYIDQNREVSPLRKAEDALLLDNTDLSIEEQKKWLFEQFNKVSK